MSIQRPDTSYGDPSHTGLIARLANELFSATPYHPAGDSLAPTPTGSGNRDIALAGGFPDTPSPSGPPPVHPTVVAPEPVSIKPDLDPPDGGHEPGSADSHEFGEPSFYAQSLDSRPIHSVSPRESGLPISESTFPPGITDYYFLRSSSSSHDPTSVSHLHPAIGRFDVDAVRRDFPALHQRVNGRPLIWLDNAATTHKPRSVIDATSAFYGRDNSNIHRAAHTLAARSTDLFEAAREKVRRFLGAADAKEIIFLRGTTEAINLVAQSYGKQHIGKGDEIILSQLEHHANIVPWQILAEQTGAVIRVIPINDRGELILEKLPGLFTSRTKFLSVTHVSNALGTVNPVGEIISIAHAHGVPVLVDGAQSTPHLPVDVRALDADFYAFSGHKVFGPTGIGALYGKAHLLESMPPWQGGGHMIKDVTFERTQYNDAPEKFEAGTPDIAGVVGLGAAIDYLDHLGIPAIAAYEHSLLEYAAESLRSIRGIRPVGTAAEKASVLGFVIPGVENHRIARYLDHLGIAVRAGHHCAMPAIRHFGLEGTVRPSLAFYNTPSEVDSLIRALHDFSRK